jgi:hypothetical protein
MPGDAPSESLIERIEHQERKEKAGKEGVDIPIARRINREVSEFVNAARDAIRWRGKEGAMEAVGLPEDAMWNYGLRINTLIKQDGDAFIGQRKQITKDAFTTEWTGLESLLEEIGPNFRLRLIRRIEKDGGNHFAAVLREQFPRLFAEALPKEFLP